MLRITTSKNSAAAKSYYAKSGDYYALGQGGDYVGTWQGRFAATLGLSGRARMEDFHSLCDNRHPKTGKRLTARNRANRRPLMDFTWSVPKSVAIMRAFFDDRRIEQAIWDTVTQTMQDIEQEVAVRVRKRRKSHERIVGNAVWLPFYHRTSRPVKGEADAGDHIHACLLNVCKDPVEGQLKAVEIGHIKERAPVWEAIWHARLAKRLYELGYDTRTTKHAFEIEGVSEDLIARFSRRTAVIEAAARMLGIRDAKQKAKLGATTRERKSDVLSPAELHKRWLSRLKPGELDSLRQLHVESRRREGREVATDDAKTFDLALRTLLDRQSVVAEDRVLMLALKHRVGEATVEGLLHEFNHRPDLIRATIKESKLISTREVLAEEEAVLDCAKKGRGRHGPLNVGGVLKDAELIGEQRRAVSHLWKCRDRISIIRGQAGTGKTRTMREVVRGIKEAGHDVVVLAPSADASRVTLATEGFLDATTVADFLLNAGLQKRARGNVVWIDEAGMLGFKDMANVVRIAEDLNARLILTGDRRQHRSVSRGEPLAVLEDKAGIRVMELKKIRRQKPADYRAAVELLAAGKTAQGFDKLDAMDAIKIMPTWNKYEPLVSDYVEAMKSGKSVMILSPTHKEGAVITEVLRERLKKDGKLEHPERELTRLVSLNLSEAERSDARSYTPGTVVQFFRCSGVYRPGQRVVVTAENAADLAKRSAVTQVYANTTLSLAAGDLIRITARGTDRSGKHKLTNGSLYRVAGFAEKGEPILSNGWVLDKEFAHFAHGYVLTSFAGQGKTVDRVFVAQSAQSYPATNQRQMYVDASRGEESVTIYTDDKRALKDAITRSEPRLHALDLAQPAMSWTGRLRKHLERLRKATSLQPLIERLDRKPTRRRSPGYGR